MLFIIILITIVNSLTLKCVSNEQNETYTRGNHLTLCIHFINKPL